MSALVAQPVAMPLGKELDPNRLLSNSAKESLTAEVASVLSRIDDPAMKAEILSVVSAMSDTKSRTSNLLKERFNSIIAESPARKELAEGMESLQESFDAMDPEKLGTLNIITRIFSKNLVAKRLKKMVDGYQSAQKKIDVIEQGMAQGARNMISDTNELLALHDSLAAQNKEIAQRLFVMDGLSKGLEAKHADPAYEPDVRFEHRLRTTVQDMKLMFIVNSEFKEAAMLTVNNSQDIVEGSERLMTIAGGLVRTGLALQAALDRQKQVIASNNSVKEFLQRLIESTTKSVHDNTLAAAEATSGPLLDIERVKASYQMLRNTASELDKIRSRTALESLKVSDTLDRVTADLKALPGFQEGKD